MNITFLGTSHGHPSAERYCSCHLLESNGALYLIDGGAPVLDLLLRNGKNPKDVRAIFTSHTHADHTFGLLGFIGRINWGYMGCSPEIYITEQRFIDAAEALVVAANGAPINRSRLRFHIPEEGVVYEDENIKVEYIRTKHHMTLSYAILVTEGDKRILFGGDFSHWLKGNDIPAVIEEDIEGFVCEMAHQKPEDYLPYLEKCRAKKVFFNHVWPLEHYDAIEAFKGKYYSEIIAPKDGDSFNL